MSDVPTPETLHEEHEDLHGQHGLLQEGQSTLQAGQSTLQEGQHELQRGQSTMRALIVGSTVVLWLLTMFVIAALNRANDHLEKLARRVNWMAEVLAELPSHEIQDAEGNVVYRFALPDEEEMEEDEGDEGDGEEGEEDEGDGDEE